MPHRLFNILFLCTANSARSIMAEVLANHSPAVPGKFRAFSAGSHPGGRVNPFAIEQLRASGLPVEDLRSKSWDEFAAANAPGLDFVITVCDNAAGETCPVWPGRPVTAHWGVPDPAAAEGDDAKRRAFADAYLTLKRRIELFAALPVDKLDAMALKQHMADIGRTRAGERARESDA